jgi:predicted outer membrane repeat protein
MIGELIPTGVTYGIGREALNDQFSGTGEFNDVEVSGNLSAGTGGVIYSGGTDLYNIFGSSSGNYLPLTVTGVTIVNVDDTDLFFTGNTGTSITTVVVGGTGGDQNHFTQVADGYASIGSIHSGNSDYFYVVANQVNGASLEYNTGTTVNLFKVTKSTMRASSTILTFPGITYDIDYSANYTNRSLVDKQYVVNTIATATTASNGLTKSGNNITLGGTLTGNTSIDVNGSYLNFVNTNPTTIAGDYKYRFLDGVTTPTIATENVSNYTEFKPITTGGAYQFASGVVMYANPSGNTNSEFYAGADLTLITTDLNKFQDSVAASLSILQFASNTGTFSGGFVNAHTSTFRNLLSGNNIQNLAHYQAFGIETDGTNASVIDNLYGFYMRNSSDGNITNKWGVYIDDPNANNYFAGNVDVDGILTSGGTDLYNIFNTTAPSGGGVQPYINVGGTGATITWNVSGLSTNYQATLVSATTTINLTGVRNGEYGTIIVTQDGVGGRTVTFGTVNGLAGTHKVVNGGGGAPTLTSTASATDILSFTYNGSTMYWTVGNDYT